MESLEFVRSHRRLVTRLAIGSLLSGTRVIAQAQVSEDWVRRYDNGAQDSATDLAVDVAGNVHVTGYSFADEFSPSDYATVKYDAEGNQLWVRRYDSGGEDFPYALAVDDAGNTYVTGFSRDGMSAAILNVEHKSRQLGIEVAVARSREGQC